MDLCLGSYDTLLNGQIQLRQPLKGYRVAIDPILLAASVPAKHGDMVADIGTGTGAAALCLLARVPGIRVVGIEAQEKLAWLANYNCILNNVVDRFQVTVYDIFQPVEETMIHLEPFNHVMSNPPFSIGTSSIHLTRSIAYDLIDLRSWVFRCLDFVQPHGSITLICRATMLDQLLSIVSGLIGGITIIPVWPRVNKPAKRCIVRGYKNSRASSTLHAGLTLHVESNYTKEAEDILRHGQPL